MKIFSKLLQKKNTSTLSRLTNETVAEHREHILSSGRKFKYPVQYARHRLVFNTIIISIVATILIVVIGWWQLYPAQNTSTFFYRVTQALPLPVASVDGQLAPYSDYLMKYRGDAHYLEQKEQISLKSDDGKRQLQYIKQRAMQDAIADAFSVKLAKKLNLSVSDIELEASLKLQRQSSDGEVSQQTQDASALSYFGWSPSEYRHATKSKLLRQKVAYAIDSDANKIAETIAAQLKDGTKSLESVAKDNNTTTGGNNVTHGSSGWVPKTNQDGGLAAQAAKLERGKVSGVMKSTTGDGYYFVRLIDSNDTQVSYEYIQVLLTAFTKELAAIEKEGKIVQYISIPKIVNTP